MRIAPDPLGVGTHLLSADLAGGPDQGLADRLRLRRPISGESIQRPLGLCVEPDGNRLLSHVI